MLLFCHTMSIMFILLCLQHIVISTSKTEWIKNDLFRSCFKDIKCCIQQIFHQLHKSKNEIVLIEQSWTCKCKYPTYFILMAYFFSGSLPFAVAHFFKSCWTYWIESWICSSNSNHFLQPLILFSELERFCSCLDLLQDPCVNNLSELIQIVHLVLMVNVLSESSIAF